MLKAIIKGTPRTKRVHFLPIPFAAYPERNGPMSAPIVSKDEIQEASCRVIALCTGLVVLLESFGNIGEVHDKEVPRSQVVNWTEKKTKPY